MDGDAIHAALAEALRPLVAEVVREELERRRAASAEGAREPTPFLTVSEYAQLHRSTPEAVRARIRRRRLHAIQPPGAREYLIPNESGYDGRQIAPATQERPGA
jgi:hypothetical protein